MKVFGSALQKCEASSVRLTTPEKSSGVSKANHAETHECPIKNVGCTVRREAEEPIECGGNRYDYQDDPIQAVE